ncbi:MAG: pantoate--beta-alanine ligase [Planctomycetes bacterium]|nr:pantoate--beta-alanine ligase [Planctomycetota bacterium]MBI3844112.1 pantoate--beta-alanine ligase [Planctomycetota bacterium]
MKRIDSAESMQRFAREARAAGRRIGLVPTMGALHEGHVTLVRRAAEESDAVVVSIFVNPLQFGPGEDFERYPRDLDGDARRLASLPVAALFCPEHTDLYPRGFETAVVQDDLSTRLCGAFRPGHFRGVLTVVTKLFGIVQPNVAFFGQKDAQQVLMIHRMARDLDLGVVVRAVETVREPDGLAMSSRNRYLSPDDRRRALALSRALRAVEAAFDGGEHRGDVLRSTLRGEVEGEPGVRLQYAEVASLQDLRDVEQVAAGSRALAAIAAHVGTTRLIDNVVLGGRGRPNAGLF